MKIIPKLALGAIAVVLMVAGGIGLASGQLDDILHTTGETAKATAANAAIDAGGYKQKIADALEANRQTISDATGMSLAEVDTAITKLDIENWQACALPSDAVSSDSFDGSYAGMNGTITTYQDPRYITVNTAGQNVTMEVPASAQEYLSYLAYLD